MRPLGAYEQTKEGAQRIGYGDVATGCIVTPSLPCGLSHP